MKMAPKFSFLNPSTSKAVYIITINTVGMRTLSISNRKVPIQYEVVPTPLTNCKCLAYNNKTYHRSVMYIDTSFNIAAIVSKGYLYTYTT